MNSKHTTSLQIGTINILRFVAAISVMLYHYTFMFYYRGNIYTDFGLFRYVFQYGYLGVDLFFIISGFVIALSAEGRNLREFVISRVTRLYPMFWVSMSVTSVIAFVWGYFVDFKITYLQFLANLTMVPSLFSQPVIDGSYWSLAVEFEFYAFIGFLIAFRLFSFVKEISLFLSAGLFITTYFFNLGPNYISYFVAGMIFYSVYRKGLKFESLIGLGLLLPVSIKYALYYAGIYSHDYKHIFNPYIVSLCIASFYLLFLGISTKKINIQNTKLFSVLGAITYPIYLLHQEIGRIFYKIMESANINNWVAFAGISAWVLCISYILQKYYERPAQKILKSTLARLFKI